MATEAGIEELVSAAIAFADTDAAFGLDDPRTTRARLKLRDAAARAAAGDDPPWALVPVIADYLGGRGREPAFSAPATEPGPPGRGDR
jgi:hypothetical protein